MDVLQAGQLMMDVLTCLFPYIGRAQLNNMGVPNVFGMGSLRSADFPFSLFRYLAYEPCLMSHPTPPGESDPGRYVDNIIELALR